MGKNFLKSLSRGKLLDYTRTVVDHFYSRFFSNHKTPSLRNVVSFLEDYLQITSGGFLRLGTLSALLSVFAVDLEEPNVLCRGVVERTILVEHLRETPFVLLS